MRIVRCAAAGLLIVSVGCAGVSPRQGSTPLIEVTAGFNLAQQRQAEFPGLAASVALNHALTARHGITLIAEGDASYLMPSVAGGVRLFGRTGPLFTERRALTWFGGVLLGVVRSAREGVLASHGGFAIQPGVGFDYGAGPGAFHLQLDYRRVAGGFVDDDRIAGQHVADLSGPRLVLGMTWRFLPR